MPAGCGRRRSAPGLPPDPGARRPATQLHSPSTAVRAEWAASQLQLLQIIAKRCTQIVPAQSEFNRGLQEPKLVACVVARALEAVSVDGAVLQQMLQVVAELPLPAAPGSNSFHPPQHSPAHHATPNHDQ